MTKKMLKAILTTPSIVDDCIVSEDCISDFLYQNRHSRQVLLTGKLNDIYLIAEYGKVVDCIDKEVEAKISASLRDIEAADKEQKWTPLELYKVDFEVFIPESVFIYSTNRKQAEQDFALWSIFDPMAISQVA